MSDTEPADKSTFPYGYAIPMMNILLRKFNCERRGKICVEINRREGKWALVTDTITPMNSVSAADHDRSADGRNGT